MKKRHLLTFFASMLWLTGFCQVSVRYYSYDGNLLNDLPILKGKESRLIFAPSNTAIIVVPVQYDENDTSFLFCWAHLEHSGDTVIFNSPKNNISTSDGYFRYECDTTIDFLSVIPILFPEFDLKSFNITYASYHIENLHFIISENRIIPTNE